MKASVNQTTCTITKVFPNTKWLIQIHCSGTLYAEFHRCGTAYEFIANVREDMKSNSHLDICLANLQQKIRKFM